MNIAVIFAGGAGSRMNTKEKPKQFLLMHGKPIIIYTLEIFEEHPDIDAIVVSCIKEWILYLKDIIARYGLLKVKAIVEGGKTGQSSIYNGLKAAANICYDESTIVLIHDGVRPLITQKTISDNIDSVKEHGSAITSISVTETVLLTNKGKSIVNIPERSESRLARAPQSFWLCDILAAHEIARSENRDDFIDSCSLMQHYGAKMFLVDGPRQNIKITTPEDFYIMRAMIDARENAQMQYIPDEISESKT